MIPDFLGCLVYESMEVKTMTAAWWCVLKAVCQIDWKKGKANCKCKLCKVSNMAYCVISFNFVLP